MLKTLGGLWLDDYAFKGTLPLLLLAYLSVESKGRTVPRQHLADLFWPAPSQRDALLSPCAYAIYMALEASWRADGSEDGVVWLEYSQLAQDFRAATTDVRAARASLEPLHAELKRFGVITGARASGNSVQTLNFAYQLSKQVRRDWGQAFAPEHTGKRSLRVALHKLERLEPQPIAKSARYVKSIISTDLERLRALLGAAAVDEARSVYRGHFLQGVEERLLETRFHLGSNLAQWITGTRRRVARDMQAGLLAGAFSAFNRRTRRSASNLAHDASTLYPELLLDDADAQALVHLLVAGQHPGAQLVTQQLRAQRFEVVLAEGVEEAAEALHRDPRAQPLSSVPKVPTTPLDRENRSQHPHHKALFGPLPFSRLRFFEGRVRELNALVDLFEHGTQVAQLVGRPGIGKTSLAVKLVHTIDVEEPGQARFDVISYATFRKEREHTLNLYSLAQSLLKALPPERAAAARLIWSSNERLEAKLEHLLVEALQGVRTLFIWDNLDDVVDGAAFPSHLSDFSAFVQACLTLEHDLCLLLVGRKPLDLASLPVSARYGGALVLDQGLSAEEMRLLLRNLDVGVADASEAAMARLHEATSGHPRLLENVVGVLRKRPALTLETLLADVVGLESLLGDPTGEWYATLSPSEQHVVDALSIYGAAVPRAAIHAVVPSLRDVDVLLDELVNAYAVKLSRNGVAEYSLLEIDQPRISRHLRDRHTSKEVCAMHRRAAHYHLAHQAPTPWELLDDVQANLAAFYHLCEADAYEEAYEVLDAIDYDYLRLWGHSDLLYRLHSSIVGKLSVSSTLARCLNALGRTQNQLGHFGNAVRFFHEAAHVCVQEDDQITLEKCYVNLGMTHYHQKDFERSALFFQKALACARSRETFEVEQTYLGYLGLSYLETGELDRAAHYFRLAEAGCRQLGQARKSVVWQGALAKTLLTKGLSQGSEFIEEASDSMRAALERCRVLGFRRGEASNLDNLGQVYRARGQWNHALALWFTSHIIWAAAHSHYQEETLGAIANLAAEEPGFFQALTELPSCGDRLLAEATGLTYTVFQDGPRNLQSVLEGWLGTDVPPSNLPR